MTFSPDASEALRRAAARCWLHAFFEERGPLRQEHALRDPRHANFDWHPADYGLEVDTHQTENK